MALGVGVAKFRRTRQPLLGLLLIGDNALSAQIGQPQRFHGIGIARFHTSPEPGNGLLEVFCHAVFAALIDVSQIPHRDSLPMLGRFDPPLDRLHVVDNPEGPPVITRAKRELGVGVARLRRLDEPFFGLLLVRGNTGPVQIGEPEIDHRVGASPVGRLTEPVDGPTWVRRHAIAVPIRKSKVVHGRGVAEPRGPQTPFQSFLLVGFAKGPPIIRRPQHASRIAVPRLRRADIPLFRLGQVLINTVAVAVGGTEVSHRHGVSVFGRPFPPLDGLGDVPLAKIAV